jgi:Ca2+-binding EF-hand superfamily protein
MIKSIQKMYTYVSPGVDIKTKKEVMDYLLELYKKDKNVEVSFRTFQNSVGARAVSPEDWKNMVKIIVNYKG